MLAVLFAWRWCSSSPTYKTSGCSKETNTNVDVSQHKKIIILAIVFTIISRLLYNKFDVGHIWQHVNCCICIVNLISTINILYRQYFRLILPCIRPGYYYKLVKLIITLLSLNIKNNYYICKIQRNQFDILFDISQVSIWAFTLPCSKVFENFNCHCPADAIFFKKT